MSKYITKHMNGFDKLIYDRIGEAINKMEIVFDELHDIRKTIREASKMVKVVSKDDGEY